MLDTQTRGHRAKRLGVTSRTHVQLSVIATEQIGFRIAVRIRREQSANRRVVVVIPKTRAVPIARQKKVVPVLHIVAGSLE